MFIFNIEIRYYNIFVTFFVLYQYRFKALIFRLDVARLHATREFTYRSVRHPRIVRVPCCAVPVVLHSAYDACTPRGYI